MKILLAIFGSLMALVVIAGIVGFMLLISANDTAVSYETQIDTAYEDNEQILGQYGQKIAEAAQVPTMLRDDLVAVFTGAIESRYGKDGSQATFQWLKEQNPNLDSTVYVKLQDMIEAGRQDFQNAQTRLIDVKRSYCSQLGSVVMGTFMSIAGFPNIQFGCKVIGQTTDDYPAITTARARDAFETGVESSPLKLR